MDDVAISVKHISKSFKLPYEKNTSLKKAVINFGSNKGYEMQHVLKGISFDIKKGEFFGIVGRNGSGKSTLLKLLAGIYTPNAGHIQTYGTLTPFIELGVGFNPELTGRENVFLNGALLGFSRKEMETKYDDIVEFAELSRFMDQKLKNYSSGMQVRLAFSIAIRAQSDVLILDEVLAVGDEAFQQKCIDIFEKYKSEKKTVVLVTHDMGTVRRFCSRAMLIQGGEMVAIGEPNEVASKYSKLNMEKIVGDMESDVYDKKTNDIKVTLSNLKNKELKEFSVGETLCVEVSWPNSYTDVKNIGIAIIKNSGEYVFGANTFKKSIDLSSSSVKYDVSLSLGPGKYYISVGLFNNDPSTNTHILGKGPSFIITPGVDYSQGGLCRLEHSWKNSK